MSTRRRPDAGGRPVHERVGGQPHDAVFKSIFSAPANARDLLRHALPPALLAELDLRSLRRDDTSLTDEAEQRQGACDVVHVARLRGSPSVDCMIPIEHRSTVDPFMPLRAQQLVTRLLDRWRRDRPRARRLPLVLPVVVYQGPGGWRGSVRLADLIDLSVERRGAWTPWLADARFVLHDLSSASPSELSARYQRPVVAVTLALLRAVHDRRLDLLEMVDAIGPRLCALVRAPGGLERLENLVRYTLRERPGLDPASFVERVREVAGPPAGEVVMSTFQQWMDKSRAEGMAEGSRKTLQQTLERLLRIKFKRLPRAVLARLAAASAAELEAWTERVLFAERLDDVFAPSAAPSPPRARRATRRDGGRSGNGSRARG
jgi:hypothetical protein